MIVLLQGVVNVIIKVSLRLEYHVCLSLHFLPLHQECHWTLNSRSILGAVRRRPVTRTVEVCAVRLVNMNTDMLNKGTNMLVLVKTRPAARASETKTDSPDVFFSYKSLTKVFFF